MKCPLNADRKHLFPSSYQLPVLRGLLNSSYHDIPVNSFMADFWIFAETSSYFAGFVDVMNLS